MLARSLFLLVAFFWVPTAFGKNFSHEEHLQRTANCSQCHTASVSSVDFTRPTHKACQECHNKLDFTATESKGAVCETCHGAQSVQIKTFPDRSKGVVALRVGGFSHQGHLQNEGKVYQAVGRIICSTCHPFDAVGSAHLPTHKECALCHSDSNSKRPAEAPYLGVKATTKDCLGCHEDARNDKTVRPVSPWDGLNGYAKDLAFDHQKHQSHNNAMSCRECHSNIEDSKVTAEENRHLPTMTSCAPCHSQEDVVSTSYRIESCGSCHQTIQLEKRPEAPYHYGYSSHQKGAKAERLYCAYCHDKNPEVFSPKKKSEDSCADCHSSEGVVVNTNDSFSFSGVGTRQSKGGLYGRFDSTLDLRNGRAFDPKTDAVDANDIDLYQVISFDAKGYGLPSLGGSFVAKALVDPGFTPAFSQFESASTLDQQPPADRGSILSNGPIDRRQNAELFIYQGYAEVKEQKIFDSLVLDARLGRQVAYDAAAPVFIDGGVARLSVNQKLAVEAVAGEHVNFFVDDPARSPVILGGGLRYTPIPTVRIDLDAINYLALIASGQIEARVTPYTWARFYTRAEGASLSTLEGDIDYYNPRSQTSLFLQTTRHFDAGLFELDYSTITTQGGTIAPDGRQLSDYENLNLFTQPDFFRVKALLSQSINSRLELSLGVVRRKLLEDRSAVVDAGFDQLNDAEVFNDLEAVLQAVALDNRLAYASTYTELSPGLDMTNILVPGLRIGLRLRQRIFDPLAPVHIGEGAFFTDVSGEGETSQTVFDVTASQRIGDLRLGAVLEAQRFDYQGRFIELAGLNMLSVSTSADFALKESIHLKAAYSFTNDLVLFDAADTVTELSSPNSPILADGDLAEVNTHDVRFVQRLLFTFSWRF